MTRRESFWKGLITDLTTRALLMLLGLASLVAVPGRISAQTTAASLVGTVMDQTGAIVPGAEITVTNKGTGAVRKATSGENGDYAVNVLPPGTYSVSVAKATFKKFEVPSITLAAGDQPRVNATLQIGDTSQTVSVDAMTPLLQTESSTLQSSVNQQTVQNLPLNGRNFIQLVQMVPGANEGPPNSLTNGAKPDDKRQSAAISVNGQSDVLNNNMIDGMDNNERLIGSIGVRPSIDAISELRVQSNVYSADTGRTTGAAINIITKSGTNRFHGTLYEYFRNDIFNTYPFQYGAHNPKQELRQNQFGGSIGGPIIHNKTFFFGDYEGFRLVNNGSPVTSYVPTLYEHQHPGDFSDQPLTAKGYIDPNTGLPYILTPGQMDTAALVYYSLFPAPNTGNTTPSGTTPIQGVYVGTSKNTQNSTVFDVRVDEQINSNNSLFARYSFNNVKTWNPGTFPTVTVAGYTFTPYPIGGYGPDAAQNGVLSYVHTFTQNVLLNLQAGYLRVDNQNYPPTYGNGKTVAPNINTALGMPNVNTTPSSSGLARIGVAGGYTNLGNSGNFYPLQDFSEAFQYQGTLSYTRGAHNLKFGSQLIRRWGTSAQSVSAAPTWQFGTLWSMLEGNYSSVSRSLSLANPHYRWWETSAYAQDDYHVSRTLTLNLGVRYDVFTPKSEVKNEISNWDPVSQSIIVAGTSGVSGTTNIKTEYGLIAPRFGFDYTFREGLVLRGGFGLAYVPTDITSNPALKNQPFLSSYGPIDSAFAASDPAYAPYAKFSGGAPPATASPASNPAGAVRGVPSNYRPAASIQYNLSVEKDFHGSVLTAAYVAVQGRHGPQSFVDLNAPPPGNYANAKAANSARPYYFKYPAMTTVAWFASEGISSYNGLQLSFERRLNNGLSFGVNYTRARLLDNYVGMSGQGTEGYGYNVNKFGDRYEYGNSDLDIRNRAAATLNYALPFGRAATGVKGVVVKGWQVNMLGAWSGGQPFTVTNASNRSGQAFGSAGTDRPDLVGNPTLDSSKRGVKQFINTAAFSAQTKGALGSAPRNPVYGPHYRHVDLSLIKSFPIHDTANLEFRAEGFNMTNTANFATPNATLGSPTFGRLNAMSPAYQPRVLQFALKVVF